jgi:hypothetical protein
VVKKIMLLLMTMALAVAMVACEAATGAQGEPGAPGAPGDPGDPGDPGTSDNTLPTASTISNLYLVVGGAAKPAAPGASAAAGNYGSAVVDLSKYFTDAEELVLTYKATSSDKTIASLNAAATTNLVTGGKLTVTAKSAGASATATSGKATITVEAYDGVDDTPASTTFDVVVATSNTAPRVTLLEGVEDLVDRDAVAAADDAPAVTSLYNKLYKADGTIPRAFRAAIEPGSVGGEAETSSLRAVVGNGKALDAVVSVTAPVSTGGNAYSISITALKPTVPVDSSKLVQIFAADSFGAETLVDSFQVEVNTPPSIIRDLPDVVLSRSSAVAGLDLEDDGSDVTVAPEAEALAIVPSAAARRDVVYTLGNYFGFLELDKVLITGAADSRVVTTPVANRGDTTCTYTTTSPSQPTGRRERKAAAATVAMPVAVKAIAADPVTATTMAAVNNGRIADTAGTPEVVRDAEIELLRTALKDSEARISATDDAEAHLMAMVAVDSAAVNLGANNAVGATDVGINKDVEAGGLGTFMLTITCEDPDARVSDSARITVQG